MHESIHGPVDVFLVLGSEEQKRDRHEEEQTLCRGNVARLEDRPEQEGDGEQKEVAEPAEKGVVEVSGEVVIQGKDGILEHQLVLVVLPSDDFADVVQDAVGRGVDIDELKRGVVIVQVRNVDGRTDSYGKGDKDGKEDCWDAEYDRSAVAHHAEGMVSRHARIVSALRREPAVPWKRSGRAAGEKVR